MVDDDAIERVNVRGAICGGACARVALRDSPKFRLAEGHHGRATLARATHKRLRSYGKLMIFNHGLTVGKGGERTGKEERVVCSTGKRQYCNGSVTRREVTHRTRLGSLGRPALMRENVHSPLALLGDASDPIKFTVITRSLGRHGSMG